MNEDEALTPDPVPSRIDRVKKHVKDNKTKYIVGATGVSCLVIGGAAGLALGKADVKQFVDSVKLIHVQYKSPNVNIALVKRACPNPIPVLCKSTGEGFSSIRRAAEVLGVNAREISKDLQGAQKHFERLPDSVFA